ncbi:predicted transcriptional regulator [Longilinea arvoryzae]|uniref:Predicted transcriptional regulator n=1 Tax=Longilinea arvoryzae TaxID=360412 RepID=A0A0S7BJM2_9CHLR|nr:MerR family transcriptional regulator [Longilinea arvoryzae]GAP15348.1 predicted transcriptional regulator [Longilinea arvoryzae]
MKLQNQDEEGMLIGDLARRANVSVRTIRFYIAEGLLPAPQARGRFATYGEDALLRLNVIRRLKETFLPLREIRERLTGLSTADVQRLLTELEQNSPAAQSSRSSALDYIDQITAHREASRQVSPETTHQFSASPEHLTAAPKPQPHLSQPAEHWRHYRLAPGVILLASDSLDDVNEKRVKELLQFAGSLFSSQGVKYV